MFNKSDGNANSNQKIAANSLSNASNTMSETMEKLRERGETINRVQEKSAMMADQAGEFARLAKQLNDQQRSKWF